MLAGRSFLFTNVGRCFGPLLTAASTARSNRDHPPGSALSSFWVFVMGNESDRSDYERKLDRFFTATGRAIREWSELEISLVFHLCWFLGIDQRRARIIWMSLPNIRARKQLLTRLAETYLHDDILTRYRVLMKRTTKLGAKRNLLAHAMGGYDVETNIVRFINDADDNVVGINF